MNINNLDSENFVAIRIHENNFKQLIFACESEENLQEFKNAVRKFIDENDGVIYLQSEDYGKYFTKYGMLGRTHKVSMNICNPNKVAIL